MALTDTESVTFLCDKEIRASIQKEADKNFEGKFSMALRHILDKWEKSGRDE